MIRPIVIAPHPALKTVAKPVTTVTNQVRALLDDMVETMYDDKGCGLAANQINLLSRMIVMDCSKEQNQPMQLVNPVVLWKSEETCSNKEGCLSFPGAFVDVRRAKKVKVGYLDAQGATQEQMFEDFWAICVQHEIDHLNGITFIDHLVKQEQRRILDKIQRR
jgi:peptide deformylase